MSTPTIDKTIEDIFSKIENLSDDQFIELEKRLLARRLEIQKADLLAEIRQIYADVPPIQFKGGTMNVEKLEEAFEQIREDLSEEEREEIISAMTGKPIHTKDDME